MTLDGQPGVARFSSTAGRSFTGESTGAVRYPSPFFDIAQTYLPSSFKAMLRWCRYYFLTNPLINSVVYKMAAYPVTDLVIEDSNETVAKKWEDFFEDVLDFKSFQVEAGLDYHGYGNAFISLFYPFQKHLICKKCGNRVRVTHQKYKFVDFKFTGTCGRCSTYGEFKVKDVHIRSARDIKLIRWNPEYITITHNEATGESTYYYNVAPTLANDIRIGKRDIIEKIPQQFINAVKNNKSVLLNSSNIYHMKRPTIAQKDRGWGMPMILPVLKDTFYLQVLRKAQECVSFDTLIETKKGLVEADAVKVGDMVRTHLGRWRKVTDKWYRDAKEDETSVIITPTSLRWAPSTYSPKHPILSIRRNGQSRRSDTKEKQVSRVILRNPHLYEEVLCPAKDFAVGDYLLYPRYLPESSQILNIEKLTGRKGSGKYVYYDCSADVGAAYERLERGEKIGNSNPEKIAKQKMKKGGRCKRWTRKRNMTEDLAYLLGWYTGDGSCSRGHITLSVGAFDPPEYVDNIKKVAKKVFGVLPRVSRSKNVNTVYICDILAQKLFKGLVPGRATEKRIPEVIMGAPNKVKWAYLRGLWEADGHINKKKAQLATSSRGLAYDAYRLLLHLGCIPTVGEFETRDSLLLDGRVIKGGNLHYHVTVCNKSKERAYWGWYGGKEIKEPRSGKSGFFWKDYFATRVCKIASGKEDSYIDFKIDEDTTFCCVGVATKNSISMDHILPMRVLFPMSGSNTAEVYSTVNLSGWRKKVEQEVLRWRCISPESKVDAFGGLTCAKDIEVGSLIKNRFGHFEKVVRVGARDMDQGEKAYKLRVRGLSAIDTVYSEDHPILAARKTNNGNGHKLGKQEFIKVSELNPRDYVGYPIHRDVEEVKHLDLSKYVDRAATEKWVYTDHISLDVPQAFELLSTGSPLEDRKTVLDKYGWGLNSYKIAQTAIRENRELRRHARFINMDEELAYVIGMYAAEGSATPKQVLFALHREETHIVGRLDAFFYKNFGVKGHIAERSENGIQVIYSNLVAAQLFSGLVPGTANIKRLPEIITKAPDNIALSAVKGLIDGDGSYYSNKTVFTSSSIQLAEDVRQIILSMGLLPGISFESGKTIKICGKETTGKGSYRVQVSGNMHRQLKAKLRGEAYSGPKHSLLGVIRDGIAWFRIREVVEEKTDSVVTIQMDGDNTFCTWGVATHNCDPNYIPVMPLPIGQETIGGQGKALMLTQEYRVWSEHIVAGMGVPIEFVMGGLSFSSSNVSLRMLENQFLDQKSHDRRLVNKFIIPRVAAFMGWPTTTGTFKKFKMADDLQRSAFNLQLNQAGKISDRALLEDTNWSPPTERERINLEQKEVLEGQRAQAVGQATIQGEAQMVLQKYQMRAQNAMMAGQAPPVNAQDSNGMMQQGQMLAGQAGMSPSSTGQAMLSQQGMANQAGMTPPAITAPEQDTEQAPQQAPQQEQGAMPAEAQSQMAAPQQGTQGMDMQAVLNRIVAWLDQMPDNQKQAELANMRSVNPQMYSMIVQLLNSRSGAHSNSAAMAMPEQKPPRRGPEAQQQ